MTRKALLSLAVAAIAILGVGAYAAGSAKTEKTDVVTESAIQAVEEAVNADRPEVKAAEAAESTAPGTTDAAAALMPRVVGNPDAPVKIEEFASLSCSHCADFYKNTYPKLKADYIDTGKVFFIYTDFPLNAPALDAAMVARCLPPAHYFNFIKMLFENQAQWAFNGDHREILQKNAGMLGMSTDSFNACVNNEELKMGLTAKMTEAAQTHKIQSTPSFLINGSEVLRGGHDYETFKAKIDALLSQ